MISSGLEDHNNSIGTVLPIASSGAHNFSFDGAYFLSREIPIPGKSFNCSANLAAWLGAPRALDKAAHVLLGSQEVSKDIRKAMKGRQWHTLTPEERAAVTQYALIDSREAKKIVNRYIEHWPTSEQQLSRQTIQMGWRGIGVDEEKLERFLTRSIEIRNAAVPEIPWTIDDGGKPLSKIHARKRCEQLGIPAPDSFSEKNESFLLWEAQYKGRVPFVAAVSRYRKAAFIQRRLEAMQRRILPSGRLGYSLKYFGAHTGRWSGTEGLNLQNLRKADFHGISLRSLLIPAPGKKLVVVDLAQVEPRVLTWLCDDKEVLGLLRAGYSFYEAQAKAWNLWDGQKGTLKPFCRSIYDAVKRLTLGAGYGMGAPRFRAVVAAELGIFMTLEEAKRELSNYRRRNPKVVKYWANLDRHLQFSVGDGEMAINLPSGRHLHYRNLLRRGSNVYATLATAEGYRETQLWGGFLTENAVQSVARDIFALGLLRLEQAGLCVVHHCHDEYVLEADRDVKRADVEEIIRTPPEWCRDLPIDLSSWEGDCYAGQ